MHEHLESEFSEAAFAAITASEQIECSLENYRTGLMIMEAILRERINQVKEELDSRDEREDLD